MAKKTSKKPTKTAKKATINRSAAEPRTADSVRMEPRTNGYDDDSINGKSKKVSGKLHGKSNDIESSMVRFTATLFRPKATKSSESWAFLTLPKEASAKLPSRGQVTVAGTFDGVTFSAMLEPDGEGGHWLKVEQELREAAGAEVGDVVSLEIAPVAEEPEPTVPQDLKKALASAVAKVREAWADITPAARRDFIHWITSPKRPETRVKRIETTCDMLAKGKRRPCCFDRSGMYSKSLSCPVADD